MLVRYARQDNGRREKIAEIYTKQEHNIRRDQIDRDAVKIINRLRSKGFQAFVVGGAVRDLLLSKDPKDFDIVTDAYPRRIRKLFWNSRVIGKRFRLVHIHFGEKIIEVSTFRSKDTENNNIFGNIAEDATRRDFSINALYYCPVKEQLFDYVEGFKDFTKKKLRMLMDPDDSFSEDPVRMIRAIKYSAITSFKLPSSLQNSIKKQGSRLLHCSVSRLTEEIFKILQSGESGAIFSSMEKLDILQYILPKINRYIQGKEFSAKKQAFYTALDKLDQLIREGGAKSGKGFFLHYMVKGFLNEENLNPSDRLSIHSACFRWIKEIITPITPPNKEVEKACRKLVKEIIHH